MAAALSAVGCRFAYATPIVIDKYCCNVQAMASCYRCGRPITGTELRQRRQVYVGESFWTLYARRRQSSHRRHYGMRIVCAGCAAKLDWGRGAYRSPEARLRWLLTVLAATAIVLLGLYFVLRLYSP